MASVSLFGSAAVLSVSGITASMCIYPAPDIPGVGILPLADLKKIKRRAQKRKRVFVSSIESTINKDFKRYEGPNVAKLLALTDTDFETEQAKYSYMQKHSLDYFFARARRMVRKHEIQELFGTEENPIYEWPPGPTNCHDSDRISDY